MIIIIKPIEAEAMQFTEKNKELVYYWASTKQSDIQIITSPSGVPCLIVPMPSGDIMCRVGCWLVYNDAANVLNSLMVYSNDSFWKKHTIKIDD